MVLLFNALEEEHFGKDVFLVPLYLGKLYGVDAAIVYLPTASNRGFLPVVRGARLSPLKRRPSARGASWEKNILYFALYLLKNARNIEFLMCFHLGRMSFLLGLLYKRLNPGGFFYIKADESGDFAGLRVNQGGMNPVRRLIKKRVILSFLKTVNLITVETRAAYGNLKGTLSYYGGFAAKVRLMYNGFDGEKFSGLNMAVKNFGEKDNIIITVGRLGTKQKNTELLLDALKQVDLKTWKVVLIGPVEKQECDFEQKIDAYFQERPDLRESIGFLGPVYDKKELWEWYNRAKVFVLPSRWESFGIVLSEALFFRNYLMSTDVGGAGEMIERGYGELIPQENPLFLGKRLQKIINGTTLEAQYQEVNWETVDISWERQIREAFSGITIPARPPGMLP
jgi:glycosyltransferase involved in cell wall biosynthesis